jgi:hypothetical protein
MRYFLFISFIFFQCVRLCAQHWFSSTLAPLPEKVSNNAVCEGFINGTAYVYSFAGIDSTKLYSGIHLRSYRLNTATNQWQALPNLPDTMGKIACAAHRIKDTIYITGGYHVFANTNEVSSNRMHRFNITTNQFMSNGPNIPVATDDHVQCVYKDSLLFLVSGWSNSGNIPNVQIYNPKLNTWQVGTAVPNNNTYKSFGASGTIIGDTLYYLGGATSGVGFGAQQVLRKGYINPFNPTQITWSFTSPAIKAYRSACVKSNGQAYWLGGAEVTYNYNGIAYNGSGGVPLSNKSRLYNTNGFWNIDASNTLPMDLRGAAQLSDSCVVLAGGMLQNQSVSRQVFKLCRLNGLVGINENQVQESELTIFPNPVQDKLTVSYSKTAEVFIFNSMLQLVKKGITMDAIDFNSLTTGIYFIEVKDGNLRIMKKVIKN